MKYVLMFVLICFCSSYSWAEAPIKPIVGGSQQKTDNSPKKPIVSKPSQPVPQPAEPEQTPQEKQFWQIMGWYQSGRDVQWSEIKGSYFGFCMPAQKKLKFVRLTLPGEGSFLTYFGASKDKPEGMVDYRFRGSYTITELPEWLEGARSIYRFYEKPAEFLDSPTFTFLSTRAGEPRTRMVFRVYENYLVSVTTSRDYANSGVYLNVSPGEYLSVCYYDRKVAD